MAEPVLAVRGLVKRFGGTVALDGVDLALVPGEVHALLGENGAGKSTLIKILAGVHRADSGSVELHGRPVDPTRDGLQIAFIHQDLGLVDSMTVAENMALTGGYPRRLRLIDWKAAREAARADLSRLGADIDPDARAGSLRAAERSIVAIARAMAQDAAVLVLDEPTAALPEPDVQRLLDALAALRARGVAILYVTHRLDEVFRVADRVTVLRDGRRVASGPVGAFDPQALVAAIVGRRVADLFVRAPAGGGRTLLTVRDLVTVGAGPLSFEVAAGEATALVGLRGAGHHGVARAILGDLPRARGSIRLGGTAIRPSDPAAAVDAGVAFVSSKRGEESVAANLALVENLYCNPRVASPGLRIGDAAERARAAEALRRFAVRPPEPDRAMVTLSGGNQQKVVLARWLETKARLLVLEEPTFGVDVGAKAETYRLLARAVSEGRAVLLVSSDFEEVAGIAHRALVLDRGRIVHEATGADLAVDRLTALASGALAA